MRSVSLFALVHVTPMDKHSLCEEHFNVEQATAYLMQYIFLEEQGSALGQSCGEWPKQIMP